MGVCPISYPARHRVSLWPIREERTPGLPEKVLSRPISAGTITLHPCSAHSRASCSDALSPGVRPTNCSGVHSQSGTAMTSARDTPSGTSNNPSPSTPRNTVHTAG